MQSVDADDTNVFLSGKECNQLIRKMNGDHADIHTHFTRERNKLNMLRVKSKQYQRTVKYNGVKIQNFISDKIASIRVEMKTET